MITILSTQSERIEKTSTWSQTFQIYPFEMGQGITIGNALRRILVTDITGYAVTSARIHTVNSEFSTCSFLRDDTLEILGNLKELIFQESFHAPQKLVGFFKVQGPCIVNAGFLQLPKNSLRILNPEQYICTIVTDDEFYCEVDIELGKGYCTFESKNKTQKHQPLFPTKPTSLMIDSVFSPVITASYTIKIINDNDGNIKESLHFTIVTKGNKSPGRCMYEGLKYLLELVYPFFDFANTNLNALSDISQQSMEEFLKVNNMEKKQSNEKKEEKTTKKKKEKKADKKEINKKKIEAVIDPIDN
jgi:DNA-directed RNA polymerase subunit alpha